MKSSITIIVLTFALFTGACVPSLNPLYTEKDLTTDAAIVGIWEDKESGETWTVAGGEKLKYTLLHLDSDGRKGEYDARLVKLNDELFLDLVPVNPGFQQNSFYQERFIATHTFVRVIRKDATLQISFMEPRWLKDHLAAHPEALRHEKINGEIVLTSSTKETQKFVLAHLNTREAFSAPAELSRKRGGV